MESGKVVTEFDPDAIDVRVLAVNIQSSSRLKRQKAAAGFCTLAQYRPEQVSPFVPMLIEALECDEARTRWSALDALAYLLSTSSDVASLAYEAAEDALFDESNGTLRLSGMRFICKVGANSPEASLKAWECIDEALQCFHGDAEYNDMLVAVAEFAKGNVDQTVKDGLISRMTFDSRNGKGALKKRAQMVIDAAS